MTFFFFNFCIFFFFFLIKCLHTGLGFFVWFGFFSGKEITQDHKVYGRKVQPKKISKTWPSIPLKWRTVPKELLMFSQLDKNWGCLRKKKSSEILQKVFTFSRSSLDLLYNNHWYFLTVWDRIQRVVFIWALEMGQQHFYRKTGIIHSKIANTHMNLKKKKNVPNSILDKIFGKEMNMHNILEEKAELANTSIHCFPVNGFQRLPCFLHSFSDRSV